MRSRYPLFQSHRDLPQTYWEQLLDPTDTVIDATCGNGHDTLVLAKLVPQGTVIAMDIQASAIEKTREQTRDLSNVTFLQQCHSTFPTGMVKLIVYNLGYLPGTSKTLTTKPTTTLQSLKAAQALIMDGGAISITCYTGHEKGKAEQKALLKAVAVLDPKVWSASHHQWLNRQDCPSLLLLQKACKQLSLSVK